MQAMSAPRVAGYVLIGSNLVTVLTLFGSFSYQGQVRIALPVHMHATI